MMERGEKILFQNIKGEILPDGCQLVPEQYGKYDSHKEARFICVHGDPNYYYKDINDAQSKIITHKELPLLYKSKDECCGCGACFSICPRSNKQNVVRKDAKGKIIEMDYQLTQNGKIAKYPLTGAITMLPDEDGFLYPVVDAEICIRCHKCISVCDFKAV